MLLRRLGIDERRATSAAEVFAAADFARGATGMVRACAFRALWRNKRVTKGIFWRAAVVGTLVRLDSALF